MTHLEEMGVEDEEQNSFQIFSSYITQIDHRENESSLETSRHERRSSKILTVHSELTFNKK